MFTVTRPVVLDINTQGDLFSSRGGYPLSAITAVVPRLREFFAWVAASRVPVVSTRLHRVVMHDQTSAAPVGIPNTPGCTKLPFTTMRGAVEMPLDCGTDFPAEAFDAAPQYIFDLLQLNPFESPRLDRLLSESEAPLWLVVGGPLESSVRMAVLGLVQRRQKVAVIRDCVAPHDIYAGQMALCQIESKAIEWLTCAEAIEKFSAKPRRLALTKVRARRLAGLKRAMRGVEAVRTTGLTPSLVHGLTRRSAGRSLRH